MRPRAWASFSMLSMEMLDLPFSIWQMYVRCTTSTEGLVSREAGSRERRRRSRRFWTRMTYTGEADLGSRPVNGCPAERACHGWQAPGFQAEQESEALKLLMPRAQGAQERPFWPRRPWSPYREVVVSRESAAHGRGNVAEAQGEAERSERPVNVRPAERASHGRRAPSFQAERDARAKKARQRPGARSD